MQRLLCLGAFNIDNENVGANGTITEVQEIGRSQSCGGGKSRDLDAFDDDTISSTRGGASGTTAKV
jgi:hypothetical protein